MIQQTIETALRDYDLRDYGLPDDGEWVAQLAAKIIEAIEPELEASIRSAVWAGVGLGKAFARNLTGLPVDDAL